MCLKMHIVVLIIIIVICLALNNFVVTLAAAGYIGYILLNENFEQDAPIKIPPKAQKIDNTDIVTSVLAPYHEAEPKTLDDRLAQGNIIRGSRSERAIRGASKTTPDYYARFIVDQANIDEAADWVNDRPDLDANPQFQPQYIK